MRRVLREAAQIGGYLIVQVGQLHLTRPISHSWLVDTGAMMSQISLAAADLLWNAMDSLGYVSVRCETAMGAVTLRMQLCLLRGASVVDPSRNQGTNSVVTYVLINPRLTIHHFVLGLNTARAWGLTLHLGRSMMVSPTGLRFQLLTKARALLWDRSYGSLFPRSGRERSEAQRQWNSVADAPAIHPGETRSPSLPPTSS